MHRCKTNGKLNKLDNQHPQAAWRVAAKRVCLYVRSFVSSGVAVDCWQSFDVPSAISSAEA